MDAPDHHPTALPAVAEGTPWTRRITITSTRRGRSGRPGRAEITTSARRRGKVGRPGPRAGITSARRRGRTGRTGTPAPAAEKVDALDMSDHPSARTQRGNGTLWTRRITTPSAASRSGRGGTRWTNPPAPAAVGEQNNRRVYARLFYLLVKNLYIIFCHSFFGPLYFRFNALLTTCALYLSAKSTSPHAFARTHTP